MDSIVLSKKDFKNLKDLIYSSSGIHLHDGKIELLKSKIAKRMRLTKKSYSDYLSYLHSTQSEVIEFIDTVTTNHSFFFRENNLNIISLHNLTCIFCRIALYILTKFTNFNYCLACYN